MYTVVLMAAMTSGSATPDWHRHGHGGCYGAVASCYGCYGGYNNTGGVPYGGTCLGTYGGYFSSGPAPVYGCWGAWGSNASLTVFSEPGSYGLGGGSLSYGWNAVPGFGVSFQCHGCYGCYGGWSCYGSPQPGTSTGGPGIDVGTPPASRGVPPAPGNVPGPQSSVAPENRVRSKVIVEVPEGAKLYVDDNLMNDGPTQRVFQTPPLDPKETYYYDIRVEVVKNGKTTSNDQRLVVRPGEIVTADFRGPGRPAVVTAQGADRR